MSSNFTRIIAVVDEATGHTETMWARPVESDLFEVRNIPFFARGCALGDVVRCEAGEPLPKLTEVVQPSGNLTVRIFVPLSPRRAEVMTAVLEALDAWGCASEVYSTGSGLIAVSIPPLSDRRAIRDWMDSLVGNGDAHWEAANFAPDSFSPENSVEPETAPPAQQSAA